MEERNDCRYEESPPAKPLSPLQIANNDVVVVVVVKEHQVLLAVVVEMYHEAKLESKQKQKARHHFACK